MREGWTAGRLKGSNAGRLEGSKAGRPEGQKAARPEGRTGIPAFQPFRLSALCDSWFWS
jgi:hypothetical protein